MENRETKSHMNVIKDDIKFWCRRKEEPKHVRTMIERTLNIQE